MEGEIKQILSVNTHNPINLFLKNTASVKLHPKNKRAYGKNKVEGRPFKILMHPEH